MKAWHTLLRFVSRFRHQVSLPEDVSVALGIPLSNFLTVPELLNRLSHPDCYSRRLERFMSRQEAELAFQRAIRIERFNRKTLCSYYFKDSWLEFVLIFDDHQQLRRVYLHHKNFHQDDGVEITLKATPYQSPLVRDLKCP